MKRYTDYTGTAYYGQLNVDTVSFKPDNTSSSYIAVKAPATTATGDQVLYVDSSVTPQWKTLEGATTSSAGLLTAQDKVKLDGIASNANSYTLPVATSAVLGGIKVNGYGLQVVSNTLHATYSYTLPAACDTALGGVKIVDGNGLLIDSNGVLSCNYTYNIPTATSTTTGGVKISGNGLVITDGILSATNASYPDASPTSRGLMTAEDKIKLDGIAVNATNFTLSAATSDTLGGFKPGYYLKMNDEYLDVDAAQILAPATATARGCVKINGNNLAVDGQGLLSATYSYTLPNATTSNYGGVKLKEGGNIVLTDDGCLSAVLTSVVFPTGSSGVISSFQITDDSNLYVDQNSILYAVNSTYSRVTSVADGLMSMQDKVKLDAVASSANNYSLPIATSDVLGGVKIGSTLAIDVNGVVNVDSTIGNIPAATASSRGGVMISGNGLAIDANGMLSATYSYTLPVATVSTYGGVKIDPDGHLSVTEAGLSADLTQDLPKATSSALGCVKINGGNLTINNQGVLSATNTTYEAATTSTAGLLTASDKTKLNSVQSGANSYTLPIAASSTLGGIKVGSSLQIDSNGVLQTVASQYVLPAATSSALGGVKIDGNGLAVDSQGKLSVTYSYSLPSATTSTYGAVKLKLGGNIIMTSEGLSAVITSAEVPVSSSGQVGSGVRIDESSLYIDTNGVLHAVNTTYSVATTSEDGLMSKQDKAKLDTITSTGTYSLPIASADTLGGIKVSGNNLAVDSSTGLLSATYSAVTSSSDGLMTAADKIKLDSLNAGSVKTFTSVTADAWVASTEYSGYAYQCTIALTGITATDQIDILYGLTEAISGDYAPAFDVGNGTITLYSKVNTSIVIPTIRVYTSGVQVHTSVSASTWTSSVKYSNYPYQCTIAITGISATSQLDVIYGLTQAVSGNYAPVFDTNAGQIVIYSKVNTSITIPTIRVYK